MMTDTYAVLSNSGWNTEVSKDITSTVAAFCGGILCEPAILLLPVYYDRQFITVIYVLRSPVCYGHFCIATTCELRLPVNYGYLFVTVTCLLRSRFDYGHICIMVTCKQRSPVYYDHLCITATCVLRTVKCVLRTGTCVSRTVTCITDGHLLYYKQLSKMYLIEAEDMTHLYSTQVPL